ncbi:DUF3784 domain-containing protein [Rossellomorea aquimaris]|uniref:DUF3784 domain-containing protein n=1 Tax=Rossellomorea aquimaris TaxID=189382 RepID=A0A5D4U9M2_9BACI|nr:DUF3784 domain-containing protein [Rossellomorea aquimaris]TYS84116.1 DUF3784 domain-containing protein [Rossellomorea aquimaris]
MFLAKLIFVSMGMLLILSGLLVWKKNFFKFIAGYVEGEIKDKKTYGKLNGMFLIIIGIVTILFSFYIGRLNVWVFIALLIVIVIGQVVINVRMNKK